MKELRWRLIECLVLHDWAWAILAIAVCYAGARQRFGLD